MVDQYMSEFINEDRHIPMSIAQIPVPVPTSSTFFGFSMGAKYSLLLKVKHRTWCWRSRRSASR